LATALAKRCQAKLDQGSADAAEKCFRGALEGFPADSVLNEGLAQSLEQLNRLDEAEAEFRQADGPSSHARISSFAGRLSKRNETERAIRIYQSILSDFAADPKTADDLIALLSRARKWQELDEACKKRYPLPVSSFVRSPLLPLVSTSTSQSSGCLDIFNPGPDAALAFYRANPNSGYFDRDRLTFRLARLGRFREAAEVCDTGEGILSRCDNNLRYLFVVGRKTDATRIAGEIMEEAKAKGDAISYMKFTGIIHQESNVWLSELEMKLMSFNDSDRSSTLPPPSPNEITLDDRLLLCVEASKHGDTTYSVLYYFLKKMNENGKLFEAMDALRRVAPNLEIADSSRAALATLSFYIGAENLNKLLYQGYIAVSAKESVPLGRYNCDWGSETNIPRGATVRLAYTGTLTCKNSVGVTEALVEYQDAVWIADASKFSTVIAPADAPIRPFEDKTFEQAMASVTGSPNASATLLDEVTLGFNAHTEILKKQKLFTNEAAKASGMRAFRMLMSTDIAHSGKVGSFQLWLLDDSSVNAFSTAGGHIYVDKGMLPIIGDDVGLWAAVLAHEAGHVVAHHQYKAYVRAATLKATRDAFQREMALGHTWATWGYLVTLTGGRALSMKLSRNDELEADRLGLLMMAQAGIHPDYAAALMAKLHRISGDQNQVATFLLSDHPRWETREKKIRKARDEALSIFSRQYASAADSPGGAPPSL
jgi:predicted Zn-dependent protease